MRTIVISGASSGIGYATAARFAAAGEHVWNLDVQEPEKPLDGVTWIRTDVADWAAVETAIGRVPTAASMSPSPTPGSASGTACWSSPRPTPAGSPR